MEPGDRDEDPDKDRDVEKEGPPSDTSHLSGQSVEDVCGDCGLLPCMCGADPTGHPGGRGRGRGGGRGRGRRTGIGRRIGLCGVQGKRTAGATPVLGAGVPAMPDEAPVAARRGAMGRLLRSADDGDHGDGGEDPRRERHVIGLCLFAVCCLRVGNREHVPRCTRVLHPLVPRRWERSTAAGKRVPAFCTCLFPVFPSGPAFRTGRTKAQKAADGGGRAAAVVCGQAGRSPRPPPAASTTTGNRAAAADPR